MRKLPTISLLLVVCLQPIFASVKDQQAAPPVPGLDRHVELWQRRQAKHPNQERWLVEQV
ncbi:MAG: hypothetical protein AAFQ98_27110 [Bacteroidota bacterium]